MRKRSVLIPTNPHRVSIVLYDADLQLLQNLRELTGIHTRSALIRLAIRALRATHKKRQDSCGDHQTPRDNERHKEP